MRRRYAYAAIALVCRVALVVGAGVEMRTGAGRVARPAMLLGVAHDDGVLSSCGLLQCRCGRCRVVGGGDLVAA